MRLEYIDKNVHVSNNSGENEWYTPPDIVSLARNVMGKIDLDPASSDIANETIGAEEYYTMEDDGLEQEWHGNVWLNPPYAQPFISKFASKVSQEYEAGNITQACVLVNNATETEWFRRIAANAGAICFPGGRIKFLDPGGDASGAPLQGQAIIYLGKDINKFAEAFSLIGMVLCPIGE